MGWYDWIPGVSNLSGLVQGDWKQALGGAGYHALDEANNYFFKGPEAEQRAAYEKAMGMNEANGQKMRDFYQGAQSKAQGYYKPMQNMFSTMYGTQGINAPVQPQGPGQSLNNMFGGKR
jgi:hypothetical protein